MTENEIIETHIAENIHRIEVIEWFMRSNSSADKEKCEKNKKVLTSVNGLLQEIQQYRAIGTIEDFKALKEKSVAKKPHSISIANDIGNSMVECPICHARSDYDVKSIKRGYCWKCGQKLDWSE